MARILRNARIGRAAMLPHSNCACANRPSNVSSIPKFPYWHLKFRFFSDTHFFFVRPHCISSAELPRKYFSPVRFQTSLCLTLSKNLSLPSLPSSFQPSLAGFHHSSPLDVKHF